MVYIKKKKARMSCSCDRLGFLFSFLGDTSLNLAGVFPQGTVVAFEMGPPIEMLRVNVRSGEGRERCYD